VSGYQPGRPNGSGNWGVGFAWVMVVVGVVLFGVVSLCEVLF